MRDKESVNNGKRRFWPLAFVVLGVLLILFCTLLGLEDASDGWLVVFLLGMFFPVLGLIVYLVLNRKRMATLSKILFGIFTALYSLAFAFLIVFLAWGGVFHDLIHYKYNDKWIIGRSITEVEERYGKAEQWDDHTYRYFLYREDFGLDPRFCDIHYAMFVDDDGVVTDVDYKHLPGG